MAKKERAVKIFLINKDKKLLLHLRDKKRGIYYPGYWCLIGGGINKRESVFDGIRRETKEEIGCDIKNLKFLAEIPSLGRGKNIDLSLFKGNINIPAEKIKLSEGQRVEFFKLEELSKLKIPNFLEKFINKNKIEFE